MPVKKAVAKVDSSKLKKVDKKSKKIIQKSKYSKSSKELPNSGDGQKWTTLVHNGVIFPPSYKPHGVKMLYNGKPVDLTPEQEEVGLTLTIAVVLAPPSPPSRVLSSISYSASFPAHGR